MLKYDTWLEESASRELARKLRETGKYAKVAIRGSIRENGKRYTMVYVERRTELSGKTG